MSRSRLIAISLGTAVALVCAEVLTRVRFSGYGTEIDRIRYVYSRNEIRQRTARLSGMPFVEYGLTPGFPTQSQQRFRGPEILVRKSPGVFRIIALGGSTTYGDHIDRWEDAYPAQLEHTLRERGHVVEVINAGVPGYSSWEMLIAFELRLVDLEPDLLLVYEGINDLFPRLVRPSQYDGMATSKGQWRTDAASLPRSALYRLLALRYGWMTDPTTAESQFDRSVSADYCRFDAEFTRCDNLGLTPDEVLDANPPKYFERNLRNLVAVARANRVQVMFSTWAYFTKAIPDVPGGTFMALPFVQRTIAEHNRIVRDVAASTQSAFYDFASALPVNREFWYEGMHLTSVGARTQAAAYADFLVDKKLLP